MPRMAVPCYLAYAMRGLGSEVQHAKKVQRRVFWLFNLIQTGYNLISNLDF